MQKNICQVVLKSGTKIPSIGFGTYQIRGNDCYEAVMQAFESGYTHIDTASVYKNQEPINKAIKNSKLKRQQLFITSKLSPSQMGYEKVKAACDGILKRLDLTYLDLLLIHWPGEGGKNPQDKNHPKIRVQTWKAMLQLQKQGKIKEIGVSNFLVHHLQHLIKQTNVIPSVNQFQLHPFLWNQQLIEYCRKNNIAIEAYSPLARNQPDLINNKLIQEAAKKYTKTPHQILIRWSVQNGFISLPKSKTKQRIISNFNVFDFQLTVEEMKNIQSLNKNFHTCWNPESIIH